MEHNSPAQLEQETGPKPNMLMTYAYCGIVFLACCFIFGISTNSGGEKIIQDNNMDVIFFFIITILGITFRYMLNCSSSCCFAAGALGSFIVLTVGQDPIIKYLTLGALLFAIGMYGMVVSRNAVRVLMSIELMLNAVNINLITFSRFVDPADVKGQLFAIFILTVAAAEAAVGLAIVLSLYRNMSTVDMQRFNLLKW